MQKKKKGDVQPMFRVSASGWGLKGSGGGEGEGEGVEEQEGEGEGAAMALGSRRWQRGLGASSPQSQRRHEHPAASLWEDFRILF